MENAGIEFRHGANHHTRSRLRVVSNFGDGDCGASEIHTRARAFWRSPRVASLRARVCISPAPQAIAKIRGYSQSTLEEVRRVSTLSKLLVISSATLN